MIIGISGKMGSGKDTLARFIQEIDNSFKTKMFAGKLKMIASQISGIPVHKFEDQEFKTTYMSDIWNINNTKMTVREFLQKLGTDGLKDGLHQNVWINALLSDYVIDNITNQYPNWIVTDVRFPEEADAIKKLGGKVVRVIRNNEVGVSKQHRSEIAMDDYKDFNLIITNNGTLDALKIKAQNICDVYLSNLSISS